MLLKTQKYNKLFKKLNGEFFTKNKKLLEELRFNITFEKEDFCFLDPACGQGDILIYFIEKFIEYMLKQKKRKDIILNKILKNFYGFDINPMSCQISKRNIFFLLKKNFPTLTINKNKIKIFKMDATIKKNINQYINFFDFVVANPPFITYYGKHAKPLSQDLKKYYILNYKFIKNKNKDNKLNSSMFFLENAFDFLKEGGVMNFILDISFFEPAYTQIREYVKQFKVLRIVDNIKGFDNVYSGQIVLTVEKTSPEPNDMVFWKDFQCGEIKKIKYNKFDFKKPLNDEIKSILQKIEENSKFLKDFFEKKEIRTCAVLTGRTEDFVFKEPIKNSNNNFYPFLEGKKGLPKRFKLNIPKNRFLEYNYQKQIEISNKFKLELEAKGIKNKKRIGLGDEEAYKNPKIFIRQSAKKLICAYTEQAISANNSIYVIFKRSSTYKNKTFLKYLTCILNSEVLTFYALNNNIIRMQKGKIPQIRLTDLFKLPIKLCSYDEMKEIIEIGFIHKDFKQLNKRIAQLYGLKKTDMDFIMKFNSQKEKEK